MIRELMALCAELKINIPVHDLINWLESRLNLVCHPHRIRGQVVLYVHTGCPFAEIMDKENKFYERAKAIHTAFQASPVLRTTDIKDRFISHGKLWLVLRGCRVVAEDEVRVFGMACKCCGRTPSSPKQTTLYARQDRYCLDCFAGTLTEVERFRYITSTHSSFRRINGYSINYDPITGVCRPTHTASDLVNRAMYSSRISAESRHDPEAT